MAAKKKTASTSKSAQEDTDSLLTRVESRLAAQDTRLTALDRELAARTAQVAELVEQQASQSARLIELDRVHAQLFEAQQTVEVLSKRVTELEGWKAAKQLEAKDAAEAQQNTPWAAVVRKGRSNSNIDSVSQPDVQQFTSAVRQVARQAQEEADREFNLVVRNLPAADNETPESLSASVHEVLKEKLRLGGSGQLVSSIRRVQLTATASSNSHGRPPAVIVQCRSLTAKLEIMRAKHGLRGTDIGIDHDYTREQQAKIRERLQEMKDARQAGYSAFFDARGELVKRDRNTGGRVPGNRDSNSNPANSSGQPASAAGNTNTPSRPDDDTRPDTPADPNASAGSQQAASLNNC